MKIIVIVIDFDIMSLTFLSKSQTSIQIVMTLVKFQLTTYNMSGLQVPGQKKQNLSEKFV